MVTSNQFNYFICKSQKELVQVQDKSFKPPEALKRYKDIKLYSEHDDATPDIVDTGVDIFGDVTLDEDELSVLRLPPDFAVLGRLSENYFQEKCSDKGNESSNLTVKRVDLIKEESC